jgi:hypothetical protein
MVKKIANNKKLNLKLQSSNSSKKPIPETRTTLKSRQVKLTYPPKIKNTTEIAKNMPF